MMADSYDSERLKVVGGAGWLSGMVANWHIA